MKPAKHQTLLIIDFGSQYTQLIARRVREMGVYCEIYSWRITEAEFKALSPEGIIISGGPATVTLDSNPKAPDWVFDCGLPVLGICYGMQTMAAQLGGEVQSSLQREFGYVELCIHGHSALFQNIEDRLTEKGEALLDVWMSHGDKVTALPPDFEIIAVSQNASIAAMAHQTKPWFGLQFHPEVTHTAQGFRILQRFVLDICKIAPTWTSENIIEEAIADIQNKTGNEQVLLGLSGGVDSSVVAVLLHKAIGSRLTCVFVDTGLLRLHEADQVLLMFAKHMGVKVVAVNAEPRFLAALEGVQCPEQKRKIIGRVFVEVFEEEAARLPDVKWLAQGTIYPDVIESGCSQTQGGTVVIKSHHNVGGLPDTLNLKLLEPIRSLFKDEVRKIGLELGLPYDMLHRHPFPGAGLGVRILGEVKKEYADILRQADAIFMEELIAHHLYHEVSQAFAVFLPVRSVGVMGDGRRYEFVICLRAVKTADFMTAEWAHLPWDFLGHVSTRIVNEVSGISRVTYDISGKPPATIEWE